MTLRRCPTPEEVEQASQGFGQDERLAQVRELLPRLDWHKLWEAEEEEEWLLYPLIPARRLIALFSAAGAGKSLLMLEMAAALSTGRKVLGHDPGRRIRVLYVDFENDPRGDVRTRLEDMGYGPNDLDHLDYLSFPTLAYLDQPQGAAELLLAVEAYNSILVVIDTISRAVAGEENDNDTWLNFYKHTGLALKQAQVALIRLDHTGKDSAKGERGGSAKRGDIDASWLLTETVKNERYRLECVKHRFQLDTQELALARHEFPLHHTVEDTGMGGGEREAKIRELIAAADRDDLPIETGARKFRTWMIGRGLTAKKEAMQEAIRRRKNSAGLAFDPSKLPASNVPPANFGGGTPATYPLRAPATNGNGQNPLSDVPPGLGGTGGHGLDGVCPPSTPPYKGGTGVHVDPASCPECGWDRFHKATCSKNPKRKELVDE